jgi:hypothetical protein
MLLSTRTNRRWRLSVRLVAIVCLAGGLLLAAYCTVAANVLKTGDNEEGTAPADASQRVDVNVSLALVCKAFGIEQDRLQNVEVRDESYDAFNGGKRGTLKRATAGPLTILVDGDTGKLREVDNRDLRKVADAREKTFKEIGRYVAPSRGCAEIVACAERWVQTLGQEVRADMKIYPRIIHNLSS